MLYQIGRICYEVFGREVFIVQPNMNLNGKERFHYPYDFPSIDTQQFKKMIKEKDVLISAPAYSDECFSMSLTGKKLMYLQGVTSYKTLDQGFDCYISASTFIKNDVKDRFGMETPVIHPFINHSIFKDRIPWEKRQNELLVITYKRETVNNLAEQRKRIKRVYPKLHFPIKKVSRVNQQQMATLFNQYRYYLTLSSTEGFGLIPLEAMASGCAVIGFDGKGGKDYFTDDNAFVVPSGDYDRLTQCLMKVQTDPIQAKRIAENGKDNSRKFTYEQFKKAWVMILKDWV